MSNSYLHLPRNYSFIQRLPLTFEISIIQERNTIEEGTWYEVQVENHTLNILSKTKLNVNGKYLIKKRSNLVLEIVKDYPAPGQSDSHYA